MEPVVIEERGAFTVLGIMRRLKLTETNWSAVWEQDFMPHCEVIKAHSVSGVCYGLYFDTGTETVIDFVAGMEAPAGTVAPADLVVREVAAATYAVFECGMHAIGPTWHAIFSDWMPGSGHDHAPQRPAFEEFREGCHEGVVPVRIWVPVVRRA